MIRRSLTPAGNALLVVLCMSATILCSCTKEKKEAPQADSQFEQSPPNVFIQRAVVVPDVTLKNVDGSTAQLADYRGKIVVLVFWAPWNKDCVSQIPAMNAIHNKYNMHRISVLGVAINRGTVEELRNFMKRSGVTFPVFYNGDEVVAKFGGVRKLPANYVILRDGTIFDKVLGPRPAKYFEDRIKSILVQRL